MTLYIGTIQQGTREVIYVFSVPFNDEERMEEWENNHFIINQQFVPLMAGNLNIVRNILQNGGAQVVIEE